MLTNDKEIGGAKNNKQRTEIKDLPKKEKTLDESDMKKVKGGAAGALDDKRVLEKSGTIN